jgi:tRNA pseudouridine55 synthase
MDGVDGLLVIDKPPGPTSHDVVATMRATLGEHRIGHTGTLDPTASGLLLLTVGRATRLTRFLSGADKTYEATIRLGASTDSYDSAGNQVGAAYKGPLPDRAGIDHALGAFRGTFLQQPPAYSAKRIGGRRSHRLARRSFRTSGAAAIPVLPAPATVTVRRLEITSISEDLVTVHVECSAGFYVRSLAHELGLRLGTGAHLAALRRIRSGDLTLAHAVPLASIAGDREAALALLVPLTGMLLSLEPLRLTDEGSRRASHGRDLGPSDFTDAAPLASGAGATNASTGRWYRLLDSSGRLLGVAEALPAPGALHPSVVLV